jgi:hypothetical protein
LVQAIQCDSSHSFSALVLIIENGTFSKPPVLFGAWLLLEQFAGFYPILLCILKEKCFGSLNIYFKEQKA